MILQPGDIFLTKGDSFVSRAIRFFTRDKGESRTQVNHVGVVVGAGSTETAPIVEALTKVKMRRMGAYRNGNTEVAIYRASDLTDEERQVIVTKANDYVGASYGYLKIVAHLLDWCLGGVYLFRRIAGMDNYPICSWVVAYAYEAAGRSFGVPAGSASPDDIWDWVTKDPKYVPIHPLGLLY